MKKCAFSGASTSAWIISGVQLGVSWPMAEKPTSAAWQLLQ